MNIGGGEAADQLVRMLLSGGEVAVRLGGSAAKNLLAMSLALAKNHKKISGKVRMGKMLQQTRDLRVFPMTQEEYRENFGVLRTHLERAVRQRPWSAVELVYNHYYNVTSVKQEIKRIYPLAEPEEVVDAHAWDDFEIEGDAQELLEDMMISCLIYEVRIAAASAYAAENIMRQNATSESLKKLDEMESEATRVERKKKNQAAFRKTIDSFIKQKSLRR